LGQLILSRHNGLFHPRRLTTLRTAQQIGCAEGTVVAQSSGVTRQHPESSLRIVRDGASDVHPSANWLLASLPPTVLAHMAPHLERVTVD
jgi:hypothetical protein